MKVSLAALAIDVKPAEDTRSTVLARLGSPSTTSIFNDNLWVYMASTREMLAFYYPKVVQREIVAIQFDEDDVVSDVLVYDVTAGKTIAYNSRVTPTRGRELGILEQLFGTIGRLPQQLPGGNDRERQRQPGE
jgi:outer membrane protein assembly factor BamE (lipoprotein component of BamABCDE complex)